MSFILKLLPQVQQRHSLLQIPFPRLRPRHRYLHLPQECDLRRYLLGLLLQQESKAVEAQLRDPEVGSNSSELDRKWLNNTALARYYLVSENAKDGSDFFRRSIDC